MLGQDQKAGHIREAFVSVSLFKQDVLRFCQGISWAGNSWLEKDFEFMLIGQKTTKPVQFVCSVDISEVKLSYQVCAYLLPAWLHKLNLKRLLLFAFVISLPKHSWGECYRGLVIPTTIKRTFWNQQCFTDKPGHIRCHCQQQRPRKLGLINLHSSCEVKKKYFYMGGCPTDTRHMPSLWQISSGSCIATSA